MISEAHRRALRTFVVGALNLDLPAGMTALTAAQVQWELQDHPRGGGPWCTLQIVAAVPTGNPERIETEDAGELVVTIREPLEVTLSVTLRIQRSDGTPSWGQEAGLVLRRVLLARASTLHDTLAAAGCAIRRVGGIRDLSGLHRGSQWETTAQVDLTLDVMAMVVERPGWIERVSGELRVADPPPDPLVVPFDTDLEA